MRDSCRFDTSGIDLVRRLHRPFFPHKHTQITSQTLPLCSQRLYLLNMRPLEGSSGVLFVSACPSVCVHFRENEPAPLECSELPFPVGHVRFLLRANANANAAHNYVFILQPRQKSRCCFVLHGYLNVAEQTPGCPPQKELAS